MESSADLSKSDKKKISKILSTSIPALIHTLLESRDPSLVYSDTQ